MREQLTPAEAALVNSIIRRCTECNREVWVDPKNLALPARIVCNGCAKKLILEAAQTEPVFILPAEPFADAVKRKVEEN